MTGPTRDVLVAASPGRALARAGDWVLNGWWGVYAPQAAEGLPESPNRALFEQMVAGLEQMERGSPLEVMWSEPYRPEKVERIPGPSPCDSCDGAGTCRCSCGNEHNCADCSGLGVAGDAECHDKVITPEHVGYTRFGGPDASRAVAIDTRFLPLLAGLSVCRAKDATAFDPIAGRDDEGRLRAVVMPVKMPTERTS